MGTVFCRNLMINLAAFRWSLTPSDFEGESSGWMAEVWPLTHVNRR